MRIHIETRLDCIKEASWRTETYLSHGAVLRNLQRDSAASSLAATTTRLFNPTKKGKTGMPKEWHVISAVL